MAGDARTDIEELLAGYALNALEPDEQRAVEQALEREPRYREMLAQYLDAVGILASGHEPHTPSANVLVRVLSASPAAERGVGPRHRRQGASRYRIPAAWALAASVVLLAAGFGTFALTQQNRINSLETEMARAEEQLGEQRVLSYWTALPGVSTAAMRSIAPSPPGDTEPIPPPSAMIMLNKQMTAGMLITLSLAPLGEDNVYQAWFWGDGSMPLSAALFDVDETGYAQTPVWMPPESFGMASISVTVEQGRGQESPTGPVVLVGELPGP